jgi:hypothetical protein
VVPSACQVGSGASASPASGPFLQGSCCTWTSSTRALRWFLPPGEPDVALHPMGQVGHADSKMAMDVYARLQQCVKREHVTAFDRLVDRARGELLRTDSVALDSSETDVWATARATRGPNGPPAGPGAARMPPGIPVRSRQILEWRDPDSSRGHHDFSCAVIASESSRSAGCFEAPRDVCGVRVSRTLRASSRRYGRLRRPSAFSWFTTTQAAIRELSRATRAAALRDPRRVESARTAEWISAAPLAPFEGGRLTGSPVGLV